MIAPAREVILAREVEDAHRAPEEGEEEEDETVMRHAGSGLRCDAEAQGEILECSEEIRSATKRVEGIRSAPKRFEALRRDSKRSEEIRSGGGRGVRVHGAARHDHVIITSRDHHVCMGWRA